MQKCREVFVQSIVNIFEADYLRRPTEEDAKIIMERHAKLGIPGALGSLDCSGWKLNCGSVADQRRNI